MTTPSLDLAAYGIIPEDWSHVDSCADLASVYKELRHIDALDQVVTRHTPSVKVQGGIGVPRPSPALGQDSSSVTEDQWRLAALSIDRQREALRSRAAFLSRGQTRKAKMTDLSVELLVLIISHFQYSVSLKDTSEEGIVPSFTESDRQTVQSLRLVSRLFNSLASPLLNPIIRLSVDQKSLDHVQAIISNPLIASSVRVIQIGLEYRPTVLARSFERWLEHHNPGLGTSTRLLTSEFAQNRYRRKLAKKSGDEDEEKIKHLDEEMRNIRQALGRQRTVRAAMRQWMGIESSAGSSPNELDDERVARYKELLRNCHDEFSWAHDEQVRLLSEKSFIGAVAQLAVQASQPIALELFGSEPYIPKRAKNESRTVYRSKSLLYSHLAAGVSWSHKRFPGDEEQQHLTASMISELPMAIHQAGAVVNAFQLGCPSMVQHSIMGKSSNDDCETIKASFQQLRILHIPKLYFTSNIEFLLSSESRRSLFEGYFAALFAGQHLEEVSIHGIPMLNGLFSMPQGWSSLGRLFGRISWPCIKRVNISLFYMTQTDLEGLFQGLGSSLTEITLDNVHLIGGRWIHALDILREKVRQAHSPGSLEGACSAHFKTLVGGEIDPFSREHGGLAMQILEDYVEGKGSSKNPLLEYSII